MVNPEIIRSKIESIRSMISVLRPKKIHEFLQSRLGDFGEFMKYIRDYFRLA